MSVSMITLARPNFQQFTNNTFSCLVSDQDFTDVTLACDDGQLVKAHKVILAAASPFFKTILCQAAQHPNPLVHIQGVKVHHLKLMLEFIYLGQAGVESDDLEDFFETTRRLQIEGVEEVLEEESRGGSSLDEKEEENVEKVKVKVGENAMLEESESPRETVIVFSQAPYLEDGRTDISETLENEQELEMENIEIDKKLQTNITQQLHNNISEEMHDNISEQLQENVDSEMQENSHKEMHENIDEQLQENMDEEMPESVDEEMQENIDREMQGNDLIENDTHVEKANNEQLSQDDTVNVREENSNFEENLLYDETVDHEESLNLDDADTESFENSDTSVLDGQVEGREEEIEEVADLSSLDQWGYARPLNLSFLPDPEVILDLETLSCEAEVEVGKVGKVDLVDQLREKETNLERKYNLRNRREANISFANDKSKKGKKGKKSNDLEPKQVELNPFHDENAFEDGKKVKNVKEAKTNTLSSINNKQVSIEYIPATGKKLKTGDIWSQNMSSSIVPSRRRTRSSSRALQVFYSNVLIWC